MTPSERKALIEESETLLAAIRGSVLVHLQDGLLPFHLSIPLESAGALHRRAAQLGNPEIEAASDALEAWIALLAAEVEPISQTRAGSLLDQITHLEASIVAQKSSLDAASLDVSEFIDESFESLQTRNGKAPKRAAPDEFEIDSEMAEIFREEAESLLQKMREDLERLSASPDNNDALWEIKRNAHTLKGAAGVVGMKQTSELAHKIEDLLEHLSATDAGSDPKIFDLLRDATACLERLSDGERSSDLNARLRWLDTLFADALQSIQRPAPIASDPNSRPVSDPPRHTEPIPEPSAEPARKGRVVRVSLERLDDLVRNLRQLLASRAAIQHRIDELKAQLDESQSNSLRIQAAATKLQRFQDGSGKLLPNSDTLGQGAYELSETARDAALISGELEVVSSELELHAADQHRLIEDLEERLMRLRNVEFGTIATRLQRTVSVTCEDEGKRAAVVIENGSLEVDTQVVDALIEPLMHLLKNAVVHGIEHPDTRRMLGKPEAGTITIGAQNLGTDFVMTVSDDGGGIAVQPLVQKAVAAGLLAADEAERMSSEQLRDLIFLPGLTTAETLSLNAGRGVGMRIVRESLTAAGGSVSVTSLPQKGTTFTLRLPRPFAEKYPRQPLAFAAEARPTAADARSVIVVDDSPSVRLSTSRVLESEGWNIVTATDGMDALAKIQNISDPVLILSDVEMPLMGGYELLARVREDRAFRNIPFVFISSKRDSSERGNALAAGAADYIVKPWAEEELIALVERLAVAPVAEVTPS